MNNADYFATNECPERTHYFARDGEDGIQAYHLDDSLCESAEFRFTQMLNDELDRMLIPAPGVTGTRSIQSTCEPVQITSRDQQEKKLWTP